MQRWSSAIRYPQQVNLHDGTFRHWTFLGRAHMNQMKLIAPIFSDPKNVENLGLQASIYLQLKDYTNAITFADAITKLRVIRQFGGQWIDIALITHSYVINNILLTLYSANTIDFHIPICTYAYQDDMSEPYMTIAQCYLATVSVFVFRGLMRDSFASFAEHVCSSAETI